MPNDPENPTSTNNKAETPSPTQPETNSKKTKIIAGSLRFLASIFLICASVYLHPDVIYTLSSGEEVLNRVGAFFMTGFALLGMALAFELPSKRGQGLLIVGTSMLAIVVLFIGSILTLFDVLMDIKFDLDGFSGCFIAGTIVLGAAQIMDLIFYLRQDERNQMLLLSMVLAILGTVFLFLGSVFSVEEVLTDVGSNSYYYYSDIVRIVNRIYENLERRAALFITGSVLYMVHAIAYLIYAMM